jgi:GNAT superfamily N-acetyltransferase
MRPDDERHANDRLEGELDALDEDIDSARRDLERLTVVHYEEFLGGPPPAKAPTGPLPGEHVDLRDGSTVLIRLVEPSDASLVKEGFEHLSAVTRYRRFLSDHPVLSESEVADATAVDHHGNEALGAVDPDSGAGVGLARYSRDTRDATRAVAAVTVLDQWQGRGVGTQLLQRLAQRARDAGIAHFEGHMMVGDIAAQRMFESVGELETTQRAAGTVDLTVRLAA